MLFLRSVRVFLLNMSLRALAVTCTALPVASIIDVWKTLNHR